MYLAIYIFKIFKTYKNDSTSNMNMVCVGPSSRALAP